jgi:cyclopropane-fatty-acyl-phospholipid synthase
MFREILHRILKQTLVRGSLEIVDADGVLHNLGDGTGRPVRIRFTRRSAEFAVFVDPEMKLGDEYVDGGYVIEKGTVFDFLSLLLLNAGDTGRTWWTKVSGTMHHAVRRFMDNNTAARARRNVHAHYDLDERLYRLFLDPDLQYSCAYFAPGIGTLEEAQVAKKKHLAAKLDLRPGQRVLDIGSGWGGLGLYLAEHYDVDVTGVTLSDEQFRISNERAAQKGLTDQVRFLLKDYRALNEKFDRIVSVGMFEHVGRPRYREFFHHLDGLLTREGVALIHTIAKYKGPGPINAWIQRYIFPGSYLPTLSELAPVIERQGLWLTDLEVLRLHYAETLRMWNQRFQANRAEAAKIYDERFCRMWEFYLQLCEVAFRGMQLCVFQMQITKEIDTLPLTRDYMYEAERQSAEVVDLRSVAGSKTRR